MKKNISKILVAVMVLSIILGVGMVSDVYADTTVKLRCVGIGYKGVDGKPVVTDPCGEVILGATLQEARSNWEQHCAEVHSNDLSIGDELIVERVFGTDTNLTDSSLKVEYDTLNKTEGTDCFADETTNVWNSGTIVEETRVKVNRASFFNITIPKEIVLNGNNGSATYEVSITGELAGDQVLVVKPDATFTLTEDGGKTTPVTVTQTKDTFNYQNINDNVKGNGTLSASGISAGNWSGKFNFNIEFKAN